MTAGSAIQFLTPELLWCAIDINSVGEILANDESNLLWLLKPRPRRVGARRHRATSAHARSARPTGRLRVGLRREKRYDQPGRATDSTPGHHLIPRARPGMELQRLRNAMKFEVNKDLFPFGNHFVALADGSNIHYVDEGTGDVLLMFSWQSVLVLPVPRS